MCFKSVIKRVAPFMLTFAVGLFIASFFVTVAAPNFQFRRNGFKSHKKYDRERELKISELEKRNQYLEKRVVEMEKRADWVLTEDVNVDIPPPPAPPTMPMKSVPSKSR